MNPLDFDIGFFTDAGDIDLKQQVWAYKNQREIMRRTSMYRGELAMGHPRYPSGSPAACVEIDAPLGDVTDIKYSAKDNKAIEDWLRLKLATPWHSLGTARIASRDDFGVVDENLNVYGLQRLKVADMSVVPKNMGSNTNNAAMIIGGKAADIIIAELMLKR
jgi:choline dehydrogenase-like flavoprotein